VGRRRICSRPMTEKGRRGLRRTPLKPFSTEDTEGHGGPRRTPLKPFSTEDTEDHGEHLKTFFHGGHGEHFYNLFLILEEGRRRPILVRGGWGRGPFWVDRRWRKAGEKAFFWPARGRGLCLLWIELVVCSGSSIVGKLCGKSGKDGSFGTVYEG